MAYDIGNAGPDLGQVQKCGGVKMVNRTQNLIVNSHFPISFLHYLTQMVGYFHHITTVVVIL